MYTSSYIGLFKIFDGLGMVIETSPKISYMEAVKVHLLLQPLLKLVRLPNCTGPILYLITVANYSSDWMK